MKCVLKKLQKIMSTLCNLNVNYGFYCTIVISLCFLLKSLTSALSQEYSFSSGKNNCGSFVVMQQLFHFIACQCCQFHNSRRTIKFKMMVHTLNSFCVCISFVGVTELRVIYSFSGNTYLLHTKGDFNRKKFQK